MLCEFPSWHIPPVEYTLSSPNKNIAMLQGTTQLPLFHKHCSDAPGTIQFLFVVTFLGTIIAYLLLKDIFVPEIQQ